MATKIGEFVDYRRWESAVGTPPLSYSSVAHFLPSDEQREVRVLRWLLYPSKFSILLSSLPSCGTATTESRNFGADHLEGPSAAELQFYNASRLKGEAIFNRHIELDLFYLDSKPVLYVTDKRYKVLSSSFHCVPNKESNDSKNMGSILQMLGFGVYWNARYCDNGSWRTVYRARI
jgi:hypothetical protein